MAIVTATNTSSPNTVKWAGTDADVYERASQLAGLAENFDLHDHDATKNLGVKRVQVSVAPTASGHVRVNADTWQWWAASAAAVRTAVDVESVQTVTGAKTFTGTTLVGPVPECRAYHNAAQSITSGSSTALAFNSERFDTDAIHDTVTNNSRLTCKTAGKYLIVGHAGYAASAAGTVRQVGLRVNGATSIAFQSTAPNGATFETILSCAALYDLALNDYVELVAFQDSGGALNVLSSGNWSAEFGMVRVGQ